MLIVYWECSCSHRSIVFSACVFCLIPISVVGWLKWFVCSSFRFRRAFWLGASTLSFCHRSTILCLPFFSFFLSQFHFWFSFVCWFSLFFILFMCVVFSFVRPIYFTHNIWMRDIIRWFHKNIYFITCQEACAFIPDMYVFIFWGSQSHCQLYCGIICIIWNKREKNQKNRYVEVDTHKSKKKLKRHHTLVDLLINW